MAPATQLSSTSFTVQPRPRPTAFTASSGMGSLQATTLRPAGLPFSSVGESSGISARAATSLTTFRPLRAMSTPPARVAGLDKASMLFSMPLPYMAMALMARSDKGLMTASDSQSWSASLSWSVSVGSLRRLGGAAPPSVMLIITLISAMPSPMQWCTRAMSALPPS